MTDVDLLVGADYLYPMSEGMPIIKDGEVAIAGDRIVYAGPRLPVGSWSAKKAIAGTGKAVLPGLVNCHSHAASLIFRSQTDGPNALGLYKVAFRMEKEVPDEVWNLTARLGCIDLLRSGVTTINDIWYCPQGLAEAVEEIGLRAVIAHKIFDVKLENLLHNDYTRYPKDGEARLKAGVTFAERWHNAADGRITAKMGTHATDTCAPELHKIARKEADRLGIGMHIHTAQSEREVAYVNAQYGCGSLEFLRDIGLLRSDVVAAHLIHATDKDLDAILEVDAGYAHCATIYPRLAIFPRLDAILNRKVKTGFGTDWMQNDPFEGMRNAMNVIRVKLENAEFLPCSDALWYQTMGSARVLGMDKLIGSLEEGKKADLISVNLNNAHMQPYYGDYSALVYYAKSSDVETSIINGRIVMENYTLSQMNEDEVLRKVAASLPRWGAQLDEYGGSVVGGSHFHNACCCS
jgi:5-methylthioadenosine/S-adenosylhomocysteine deaminase